jgi:hypothetical protein
MTFALGQAVQHRAYGHAVGSTLDGRVVLTDQVAA